MLAASYWQGGRELGSLGGLQMSLRRWKWVSTSWKGKNSKEDNLSHSWKSTQKTLGCTSGWQFIVKSEISFVSFTHIYTKEWEWRPGREERKEEGAMKSLLQLLMEWAWISWILLCLWHEQLIIYNVTQQPTMRTNFTQVGQGMCSKVKYLDHRQSSKKGTEHRKCASSLSNLHDPQSPSSWLYLHSLQSRSQKSRHFPLWKWKSMST